MSGNVVEGGFKQTRTVIEDMQKAIKESIYSRIGHVSVAEVIGVLRIIEHEVLDEQRD